MKEKISRLFIGRRKWLTIPVFVFLVGLIAVIIAAFIFVDAPEQDEPIQLSYELSNDSAPDLVTGTVNDALNKKYLPEDVSVAIGSTAPYWHTQYDTTLYINYTDNDASSLEVNFDGSDLLTSAEITKERTDIINTITASLKTQGFKKVTQSMYGQSADIWYNDGIICAVDTISSDELTSALNIRCGSLYWYDTDLAEYRNATVFADAFKKAGNKVNQGDIFSLIASKDSTVEGYQKATVSYSSLVDGDGSGASLLFYKKGEASWKFFTATQDKPNCAAYNTADLQNAFKGDTCYDQKNDKDSIVQ